MIATVERITLRTYVRLMFSSGPSRSNTLICADLATLPSCNHVSVAGLVVTRQRPGTASGVIFMTLEDESGTANVIIWPRVYERFRSAIISARLLRVSGQLQRENAVHHLIAREVEDLSHLLDRLGQPDPTSNAARSERPSPHRAASRHPREQAKSIFPSRDFR